MREVTYWRRLWKKAANGYLGAQGEVALLTHKLERSNKFLAFCADRLEHVYGENPNVDYLLHARECLK